MWNEGHSLKSGRYHIKQHIGSGGFGTTYIAEDSSLNTLVVIKVPNSIYKGDQEYERYIRRFQRESQVLSKINHPNIVRVIDYFYDGHNPCLVMNYINGETLNRHISRKGRLSHSAAITCFQKLAQALHEIHLKGLIHCDIHPGNIILQPSGNPVLIDFGSTKLLQPGTYTVTTTINDYTPYEQGNQQDRPQPSLDVYGLAATCYFAVTGIKPQAAIKRKMFGDKLEEPKHIHNEMSDYLNQAILSGMALEPQDRPCSIEAWLLLLHPTVSRISLSEHSSQTSMMSEAPKTSMANIWLSRVFWLCFGAWGLFLLLTGEWRGILWIFCSITIPLAMRRKLR